MDLNQITDAVKQAVSAEVAPIKAEVEALKHGGRVATDNAKGIAGASQPSRTSKAARVAKVNETFAKGDQHQGKGLAFGAIARAHGHAKMHGGDVAGVLGHWGYEQLADEVSDFSKAVKADPDMIVKVLGESTVSAGGALVPPQYSAEVIELLREKVAVEQLGVPRVPMGNGNLTLPKQTSGATASYTGESVAVAPSTQGTGTVALSAKKLMATVAVTNELLADASPGADAFVRNDLVAVLQRKADITLIRGTGSAYAPRGIRYWATTVSAESSASTAPTLAQVDAELYGMIGTLQDANVECDPGRCAWLMNPRTWRYLAQLRDGVGSYVFRDELAQGRLLGYRVAWTQAIPKNLGGGTNESELYFVDIGDCLVGESSALEIEFFPNGSWDDSGTARAGISRDESVFRAKLRHDFIVRHGESATVRTGVKWGA